MSSSCGIDSDQELEELASICLLSQCPGCVLCQNSEFLTASRLIEELQRKIKEAADEVEHLKHLRQLRCHHFIAVTASVESCPRCGLSRPRTKTLALAGTRCVRQGCDKEIEQGLCPKYSRPKRACSRECYASWKESQEATLSQQTTQQDGCEQCGQGVGGSPQGQETQGATGTVRQGGAPGSGTADCLV